MNISVEIQQNKVFNQISEGELSWSDMQSLHDIVQKLLDENTEILTKYEKLMQYKLMDSDINNDNFQSTGNRLRVNSNKLSPVKTAINHFQSEGSLQDTSNIGNEENLIVKENDFNESAYVNPFLDRQLKLKSSQVEILEDKNRRLIDQNRNHRK